MILTGIIIFIILLFVFIILCKVGTIVRFKNNIKHINHSIAAFDNTEEVKVYLLFDYLYIKNPIKFYDELRRLLKEEPEYFFNLLKIYCINYENTVHVFTSLFAISKQRVLYTNFNKIIRYYLSIETFINYINNVRKQLENNKEIDKEIQERRLENLNILEQRFKEVIYNAE